MPTLSILVAWTAALAGVAAASWALVARSRALRRAAGVQTTYDRLIKAVDSASDAIGIGDAEGNSIYHNRAHIALFGYTVEQLNAKPGGGVLFADPEVARAIFASIRARTSWVGETEILTREGRRIPTAVRADAIVGDDGRLLGIFGVFTDITERLRAERAIEEKRRELITTLRSISDAVITVDASCRVTLVNPSAEELLGRGADTVLGRALGELLVVADERTRSARRLPVEGLLGHSSAHQAATTYLLLSPGAPERVIADNTALIRDAAGRTTGAVLALRDITRERRREVEEARASKLESLGLLAGGIAHDFGNLLTALIGNISILQMEPNLSPASVTRLETMDRIGWRARDLTQQLLIFAKGGTPEKKVIALGALFREAASFAVANTPVTLRFEVDPGLWPVSADEAQVIQVINNLAVNAVQAMPAGGSLVVSAANRSCDEESQSPVGSSRWIEVQVADTGPGISPENLEKIFEPFFTTKQKGTGLGLATCYSIIKSHGGRLRVDSQLGSGTTFSILLPAVEAPPPSESKADKRADMGRILIMDDDRQMRESVSLMLGLSGYESADAQDGEEAIRKYVAAREAGRPFDVVLLDLRVPVGMGGLEAVKKLAEIDPAVKAIASSGYPDDPAMLEFKANGFVACLPKPFKLDALRTALKAITG